jgi:hypothetical protein
MMASLCARVAKTRCRDCLLDTHAECPVLAAIFPAQTQKVILSKGLFCHLLYHAIVTALQR